MGYQSKIAAFTFNRKKNIRDYKVKMSGTNMRVIRLNITENKYGDEDITVVDHDDIIVSLDIPGEIPVSRLRVDLSTPITTTESIYLYDILPIIGVSRLEDNVEKGDILIQKLYDEDDVENETNYLWILQVSELLGNYTHGYLVNRRFQCAPYNKAFPSEVQTIIDSYNLL